MIKRTIFNSLQGFTLESSANMMMQIGKAEGDHKFASEMESIYRRVYMNIDVATAQLPNENPNGTVEIRKHLFR